MQNLDRRATVSTNARLRKLPPAAPLLLLAVLVRISAAQAPPAAPDPALQAAAAKATPHSADGHVDLSGRWNAVRHGFGGFGQTGASQPKKPNEFVVELPPVQSVNQGDTQHAAARLADEHSRPMYKSEADTAKARNNFIHADYLDPAYQCASPGVARLGEPEEIVSTPSALYLLYATQNRYRIVPIDGRQHDPSLESMPNGDSIGHWEADTLVIDTVNISAETWVDHDGSFHSKDLHVIERLKRKGDTLEYRIRLEDPIYAQAFEPAPRLATLARPGEHIAEDYPCVEKSLVHMVTTDRH